MEGKKAGDPTEQLPYVIRITFGIVHSVILTLVGFLLILSFPSFSHFLFGLYGCILAPLLSFCLTVFCNACVEYVSQSTITVTRILQTAWIPPFGVFCCSLFLVPLERIPSLAFLGPLSTLAMSSTIVNFLVVLLLQVYAARVVQSSSESSVSEEEAGSLSPIKM